MPSSHLPLRRVCWLWLFFFVILALLNYFSSTANQSPYPTGKKKKKKVAAYFKLFIQSSVTEYHLQQGFLAFYFTMYPHPHHLFYYVNVYHQDFTTEVVVWHSFSGLYYRWQPISSMKSTVQEPMIKICLWYWAACGTAQKRWHQERPPASLDHALN